MYPVLQQAGWLQTTKYDKSQFLKFATYQLFAAFSKVITALLLHVNAIKLMFSASHSFPCQSLLLNTTVTT